MASIGLESCFKTACMATSELVALPGEIVGYLGGRTIGAVAGTVVVGGAKLSNKLFNTNYKPRSINEYSTSAAGTCMALGSLTSSIMIPAATAPMLGIPVILGRVFGMERAIHGVMELNERSDFFERLAKEGEKVKISMA